MERWKREGDRERNKVGGRRDERRCGCDAKRTWRDRCRGIGRDGDADSRRLPVKRLLSCSKGSRCKSTAASCKCCAASTASQTALSVRNGPLRPSPQPPIVPISYLRSRSPIAPYLVPPPAPAAAPAPAVATLPRPDPCLAAVEPGTVHRVQPDRRALGSTRPHSHGHPAVFCGQGFSLARTGPMIRVLGPYPSRPTVLDTGPAPRSSGSFTPLLGD